MMRWFRQRWKSLINKGGKKVNVLLRVESSDEAELGSVLRAGREALEDGLEDEIVGWRWKSLIWKGWKEVGTSLRV